MDLASKLVVVISDEDVGELTRHIIQCPEAITSCPGSIVEMDRGELCDHEGPSRAGRVLKDVRVRQWTFQGFGHFSGARDGETAKVSKACCGFTWSIIKERTPAPRRTPTLPASTGFICRSIQATVSGDMTRTIASRLVRGGLATMLPMSAGRRFRSRSQADCSSPARIRSRTSPAMVAATSSEIACGCALYLYPRWAFAQVCPVGPASGTHPCTVLGATGKR